MAERIGRYEIKRELGRGGMAAVYLAFDPRFRRQVAVKVLPRQFTHDPRYLARFEQEAQTIATLEHPAIVPVYDFGEHEDAPYLVMRYMAGGNLRARLSGEPLPLQEIASALDRLAPALDHAHELGIIHRDLKPANILFDYEGRPYLADFGIARLAEASHTMTVVGTPAYMSPEQAESKVKLDGRSDVYALGVMLYELLSGVQPYTAETPTGQMLMHVLEPVPDILKANPKLPPEAQKVIEKGMAKDRDERYQSAADLATAVNALLVSEMTAESAPATAPVVAGAAVENRVAEPEAAPLPSEDVPVEAPDEEVVRPETEPERAVSEQEVTPPERVADRGVAAEASSDSVQPVSEPGAEARPSESAATWRDLPIWVWGLAALALLVIVGLGIRFVLPGDPVDETPIAPTLIASVAAAAPIRKGDTTPIGEIIIVEAETPTGETSADADMPPPEAVAGDTWLRLADEMTMVFVPAGSFPMGSDGGNEDELPVHEVALDGFWIDRTEVTNSQYGRCVSEGSCEPSSLVSDGNFNGDDYPVVGVSWFDAEAYCTWTGASLPSEAQWEYAARGPEGPVFPWGDEFDGKRANFCDINCPYDYAQGADDDGFAFTAPVGSYEASASWAGELDMAGNVWEWVNDWYDSDYYANSPARNPQGPESGELKMKRGGAWGSAVESLRSTTRDIGSPDLREDYIGFRCVVASGS